MNPIEEKNVEVIKGLYPGTLWHMFTLISSIPRESKNEAAIADFVFNLAKGRFPVKRDQMNNVVVYLPASPGFEKRPSICLQGHLDMVGEKRKDVIHNFATDPIEFILSDGKLMANGTTLGGDNGIGAAAIAAIIVDEKIISHGPLELLFTTMEEVGFDGASALDANLINSKYIINLDSEAEGEIFVGCAGGGRMNGTFDITYVPSDPGMQKCYLKIKDLKGGHSGLEIHLGRANAIKLLGRILQALTEFGVRIVTLEGGNKMNAIPRDAKAVVMFPVDQLNKATKAFIQLVEKVSDEYQQLEPNLYQKITLEDYGIGTGEHVFSQDDQDAILELIEVLPHGVIRMDSNNSALVETSNNLGIIKMDGSKDFITCMFRGSVESQMDELQSTITGMIEQANGKAEILNRYAAWEPRFDTSLLAFAKDAYNRLNKVNPAVKTIHAGLECAVFSKKFPDAEIISFGPTLHEVHTPDEYVDIFLVGKFWNFLLVLLETHGAPGVTPVA